MATAADRRRWAPHGRLCPATLEKVVLVGLLSVIFGQVLPGAVSTEVQLFLGIASSSRQRRGRPGPGTAGAP